MNLSRKAIFIFHYLENIKLNKKNYHVDNTLQFC